MSSILDKIIVLKTNRAGHRIGFMSVRDAVTDMTGGRNTPPSKAWDIEYGRRADGTPDYEDVTRMVLVGWEDWIHLPVLDHHLAISTSRGEIRVPTVLMVPHYSQMPMVRPAADRRFFFEREGGLDAYTGETVPLSEGTLDHVIPRGQGGASDPTNLVWTSFRTNQFKRNRRPEQCGLTLRVRPHAPARIPIWRRLQANLHPDWRLFVRNAA